VAAVSDDDWIVVGDRLVLLTCCIVIVLYATGVLR